MEPNARVISIRKNNAEKKLEPTILVTTSGYAMKASPGPPFTTLNMCHNGIRYTLHGSILIFKREVVI